MKNPYRAKKSRDNDIIDLSNTSAINKCDDEEFPYIAISISSEEYTQDIYYSSKKERDEEYEEIWELIQELARPQTIMKYPWYSKSTQKRVLDLTRVSQAKRAHSNIVLELAGGAHIEMCYENSQDIDTDWAEIIAFLFPLTKSKEQKQDPSRWENIKI